MYNEERKPLILRFKINVAAAKFQRVETLRKTTGNQYHRSRV